MLKCETGDEWLVLAALNSGKSASADVSRSSDTPQAVPHLPRCTGTGSSSGCLRVREAAISHPLSLVSLHSTTLITLADK